MRLIHFSHPACADGGEDFIGPEALAGRKRHLISLDLAKYNPDNSLKHTVFTSLDGSIEWRDPAR